ncbi:MAG: hypothetical protein Q8M07_13090, partial [Prosthecobacter sp.]|nr:hypothetical protein [Prosthecobacter sp.]
MVEQADGFDLIIHAPKTRENGIGRDHDSPVREVLVSIENGPAGGARAEAADFIVPVSSIHAFELSKRGRPLKPHCGTAEIHAIEEFD